MLASTKKEGYSEACGILRNQNSHDSGHWENYMFTYIKWSKSILQNWNRPFSCIFITNNHINENVVLSGFQKSKALFHIFQKAFIVNKYNHIEGYTKSCQDTRVISWTVTLCAYNPVQCTMGWKVSEASEVFHQESASVWEGLCQNQAGPHIAFIIICYWNVSK